MLPPKGGATNFQYPFEMHSTLTTWKAAIVLGEQVITGVE